MSDAYRPNFYILQGHEAVPVGDDVHQWARMFEATEDRRVAETMVEDVRVSTVFLGLDHRFIDDGPPLLFETMIFGGDGDKDQWRCSTWEQAEAQHRRAVELVRRRRHP